MLKTKKYSLNKNTILTNEVLNVYINNFWNEVFKPLIKTDDKHLMLLCKVEFSDSTLGYRTLGQLRKVNFTDKKLFITYLTERVGQLTDAYTSYPINKIIFSYIVNKGLAKDTSLQQSLTEINVPTHRFNNMNLPLSMNPSDYGKIISKTIMETFVRFIVTLEKRVFQIDVSHDGTTNNSSILGGSDLKWVDTVYGEGFKREIGKSTIYFVNGEIVLRKQQLSAKPFTITTPPGGPQNSILFCNHGYRNYYTK